MIDSHCHLNFNAFKNDYREVISRSLNQGVKKLFIVGSNYETSKKAIEIAKEFPDCYAALGLHPIHVKDEEFNQQKYHSLIRANRRMVKAIGETGLDFYRNLEIKNLQEKVFKKHIELAREFNLPIILHCRGEASNPFQAYHDLLDIIQNIPRQSASSPPKSTLGVIHCFSANWSIAQEFLNLGFYLGFTGIITFSDFSSAESGDEKSRTRRSPTVERRRRATTDLLDVVRKVPLDRILIETDAPYLAPEPYRGQRCEPWQVKFVAQKIAEIKDTSLEQVIEQTTKNAKGLFGI